MKMIGSWMLAVASSCCMSSPLRPGKRTSSTMQPGRSGRLLCRNSCGEANSSTANPTERNKLSSDLRTEESSSMTTIEGVSSLMGARWGSRCVCGSFICPAITGEHRVEIPDRGARSLWIRPDRADDGEEVGAGLDQRAAIFLGDPADRDTGHDSHVGPVAQHIRVGAMLRRLGAAGEKRAESDVIRAGFGRGDRAMAAVAAGHANNPVGAEKTPRLRIGGVLLADMHAVAIELGGEVRAVVHDEGDAEILCDRLQDARRAPDRVVVDILEAQLQAGDIAAGKRLFELPGKTVGVKGRRRDQV